MRRFSIITVITGLLVSLAFQAASGDQYFESYLGYHVGSYPYGIASDDFNEDGNPDLVTANYAAGNISVLIGNGDGTFATRVNYSTGSSQYPYFVTTGDMDGDGQVDIITGGSMGIVIFYGVGDGTFSDANVDYFGEQVLDVLVADFDQDGYLDIATSHAARDSVGIHINNHDSTYATHFVAAGNGTVSLAAGKLDSDDYIDILVGCNDGTVWNLENDQAGSFVSTMAHLGILSDPARVAVIDLDDDGIDDFGVVHSVNDYLYTYLNNGDGTYTIDKGYILTDNPTSIDFADVNSDDLIDVLVCIGTTDEIELYLNQGENSFSLDSTYTVGGKPRDLAFADYDGDGYEDMAVSSYTTDQAAVLMSRLSLILSVDDVTAEGAFPDNFTLEQNYPNPFNPLTRIRFALPRASHVKVEVLNMLGQSVMVLVDDYLTAGIKEITWNGVDGSGNPVASGIYMYRITSDRFAASRTMVLLK